MKNLKKTIILLLLSCIGATAQEPTTPDEFVAWFNAFKADSSRVLINDSTYSSPVGEIPRMYVVYNRSTSKALMFVGGKLIEIAPNAGIRAEAVLDYRGRVLDFPQPFRVWSLDGKKSISVVWQPCIGCTMKLNYASVGFNTKPK